MNDLTIKIIYDNCLEDPTLREGWGFSAFIETGSRKILFDTGNDLGAFLFNSEKLQIDCGEITDVLFSHKHADHTAGCKEILGNLRENCRIFLPKGFPARKIPNHLQIQIVTDFLEIDKGIFSMVLKGGAFFYEQALIVQTEQGLVIVTGCAHPGIVHIVRTIQEKLDQPIHLVVGGFHLFKKSACLVKAIVDDFQSLRVKKVAPCHCSGEVPMRLFQETYQGNFCKIGTGSILTIPDQN